MTILDKDKKQQLIEELLENYVKEFLTELDIKGIDRQFATQRNRNFKNHAETVADLKAKGIYPEFIDFGNGIAAFSIKSSEWKMGHGMTNTEYTMAIRFYEWPKFYDDPQLNLVQRVNNLGKGNIGIMCSCPSFQYNYGYQSNIKKSEFYDEEHRNYWHTMPAPITNPANIGIGCKHLALLLNPYAYKLDVLPEVYRAIQEKMPNPGAGSSPSAPNSKRNTIK